MRTSMKTVIINYGMGNLGSVRRALEECGANAFVSTNAGDLANADRIVLPGVGAFRDGMKNLLAGTWPSAIEHALENPNVALLGICLGMQLLAEKGYESGETKGLGFIPGEVRRMMADKEEQLPHVGWNEVNLFREEFLFSDISDRTDFYFVHSYQFNVLHEDDVVAKTPYCRGFVSAVRRSNVFGTQFHPEKSSRAGFQLLRNFLSRSLFDA
jgi:glutamine amidotransferase